MREKIYPLKSPCEQAGIVGSYARLDNVAVFYNSSLRGRDNLNTKPTLTAYEKEFKK